MSKKWVKRIGSIMLAAAMLVTQFGTGTHGAGPETVKAETANLIVNGDFETGELETNWNFEAEEPVTATVKGDGKNNGAYGLVIYNPWVDSSSKNENAKLTQIIGKLTAGTYRLSVAMAGTTDVTDGFNVIKGGEVDSSTWKENESTAWNDFRTYTVDITLDSDQENYEIGIDLWVKPIGNQSVLLDDITLTEVKYTYADLSELMNKVPDNYANEGFQPQAVETLKTAFEAAQGVPEDASPADIETAYHALEAALNSLVYEDPTIQVTKVEGLNDRPDFIKGVDISSYLTETASGVVYKNQEGQPVSGTEFIKTFTDVGINYIRLRVWNEPYDSDSSGNKLYYGGGNNDMDTTLEICRMIRQYNDTYVTTGGGVKVLIDLQYSDFWADPDKQTAPKAWKDMDINAKTAAVRAFTKDCLAQVEATGVTVGMVQVGNETNTGICGTKYDTEDYYAVFRAGCDAVREYNEEKGYTKENGTWIKRVVHFTDPHSASTTFAESLQDNGVEYDVYATSYYPFWHGTPEQLHTMLKDIAAACGCEVMVAETQYVYTNEDYDGADNQAYEGKENINLSQWPVSVQGQANEIRDVINAVASVGDAGIGMFYWEPGWLGVGNAYNADGTLNQTALEENRQKWNTYGSGWASDYAKSYDEQAEKWGGGGTNNENASLFDFTGMPHASLNVFKYVNYGAVSAEKAFYRADVLDSITVPMGTSLEELTAQLAANAGFSYNDGTTGSASIVWDSAKLTELVKTISATDAIGNSFTAEGTISVDGAEHKVTCSVMVAPKENLLKNGDFESSIDSEWTFENGKTLWRAGADNKDTNPRNGDGAVIINTYNKSAGDADANGCFSDRISQEVTGLAAGTYEIKGFFEGLDGAGTRTGEEISISAVYGDGQSAKSNSIRLNGWMSWQNAVISNIVITEDMVGAGTNNITVSVSVCLQKDCWGSFDDIYLYQIEKTEDDTDPDDPSGDDTQKVSILEIENAGQTIKAGGAYTLPETVKVTYNDHVVINEKVIWSESDIASIKVSEPGTYVIHGTVTFSKKVNDGDYAGKTEADVTYQLTVQKSDPGTDTNTNTSPGSNSSGSQTTLQPENVTITVNPDGSITETKKVTEKNQAGNVVAVTTVTEKATDGSVLSVTETSVIENADRATSATVTVVTDTKGTVTASAEVTKTGTKTASGRTDGTITTTVMKQVTEAAGTSNVRFRQIVLNADGSTRFTVEADMRDLTEGKALTIMKLDPKTGDYYLCNQKDYMVTESGVSLIIKTAGSFILLNEEDAKAASDAIIETLKPKKSSVTVKVGKTTTAALSSAFNMKNVSKITYTTSNKSVATVNKKGKVTAKKSGTVTIKVKAALKNGVTKTITMKVKVNK